MSLRTFNSYRIVHHGRRDAKSIPDGDAQLLCILGSQDDDVSADLAFQCLRRVKCDEGALIENHQSVTLFGLIHQMRCQQHGGSVAPVQSFQVLPELTTSTW